MSSKYFRILLHREFIRKIKKLRLLDSYIRKIKSLLSTLKSEPIPWREFDIKKIEGGDNLYRIRIGNYRIFYSVDKKEKLIKILDIEKRGRAYKQKNKRIQEKSIMAKSSKKDDVPDILYNI